MGIRGLVVAAFQRETQNISGFLIGLIVGVGGGLFAGLMVASALMDWAWTKNATLWDVMTAFGTVGAVLMTLVQAKKLEQAKQIEEGAQTEGMLSIINESVENLSWLADHFSVRVADASAPIRYEVLAFLSSVEVVERIPFHEKPYCKYHSVLVHVLSQLRSTYQEVREYTEKGNTVDPVEFKGKADNALLGFERALDSELFAKIKKPGPVYFLPSRLRIRAQVTRESR